MGNRKGGVRAGLAVALLTTAIYAGASGYWLLSNRIENTNERAYVTSPDDEDTRKEVMRRCGGPVPAPPDHCVQEVQDAEESKQRERADLKAQQEVAEWTFATALIAFGALFLSAGGLGALVWTFREQRKLAINESRAYLELVSAHYQAARYASIEDGEDTEDTIYVQLTLYNAGETPALNVSASLDFDCTPDTGEPSYTITGISGGLPEIPAKGTYNLNAVGKGPLPHPTVENPGWRYQGPELRARGRVTFRDVFTDDSREIEITLTASEIADFIRSDPPVEFYGPHRARHGADKMLSHHRARYEKAVAARDEAEEKRD